VHPLRKLLTHKAGLTVFECALIMGLIAICGAIIWLNVGRI
jgi:Flp pilus assembly pilin Flp